MPVLRQWRNWQTHQLEGLAVAIPWRFESSLPHQQNSHNILALKGTFLRYPSVTDSFTLLQSMLQKHNEL